MGEHIHHSNDSILSFIPGFSCCSLNTFCLIIGFIWLVAKLITFLNFIYSETLRPEKNHLQTYGKGSYAFVTGASDGIGKAFCFSLAKRGFNVILAARNENKLKQVAQEIKAKYPSVDTKIVVANFVEVDQPGFFDNIFNQIKDVDVSLLINNVGVGHSHYLTKLSESQLKELITVNCVPTTILSRNFVERFVKRDQKSCLITLSSVSVDFPLPAFQTYGATKAFLDYFTRSTSLEYPQIDCLSVRPGLVDTNMTKHSSQRYAPITPEQCAEATLQKVGYESVTYGHWKHRVLATVSGAIPAEFRNFVSRKAFTQKKKTNSVKLE